MTETTYVSSLDKVRAEFPNARVESLWNWDEFPFSLVFQRLVIAAKDMVSHQGDLFHDAMFLKEHVVGDEPKEDHTFYWSVRETGTSMSLTVEKVWMDRSTTYRCDVVCRNDTYYLAMEEIK